MRLEDDKSPILYSTMSFAAYNINRLYYKELHYMWCTPFFRSDLESFRATVPLTSSPFDIYRQLKNEAAGGEGHGYKIEAIRLGIKKGAEKMMEKNVIEEVVKNTISRMADTLDKSQFWPLMCVISRVEALSYPIDPDPADKASPLSREYVLVDLPETAFDIIRL